MEKKPAEPKSERERQKKPCLDENDQCLSASCLRSGCRQGWEKVFDACYSPTLTKLAIRGAKAPELQEFFYEAFEALIQLVSKPDFDCNDLPDSNIPKLLWVIAYRKYLSWLRKSSKWPVYSLDQMMEDVGLDLKWESELEAIEEREENLSVAAAALSSLPKEKRKLIELRIYHGLSFREIALEMGYFKKEGGPNEAVARVYYRRAIQSLRKIVNISTSA